MESQVKVYSFPGGEIQRVQLVRLEDWSRLDFLQPGGSEKALGCFADIYRQYLVPACPWLFGNMVLFRIPEDVEAEFPMETGKYGAVADPLTAAAAALEEGVSFRGKEPVFRDARVKAFWDALDKRDCLRVVRGKLPITTIIPVGNTAGYLTETEQDAALKGNASFFIMDRFDCATAYDHVGTSFGLRVKDGVVLDPPLYGREALIVNRDGKVSVRQIKVEELDIEIRGRRFRHGENARIWSRPRRDRTPATGGRKLVIVGCRVAAVCEGSARIPASGFVLCPEGDWEASPGDAVIFRGMEDVAFGIQVGNSIVKDGVKTEKFVSRFYNIRHLEPIPYPPSLYPMNFRKARAARIALGADAEGRPMLLWAEGAAKLGYVPGRGSRGASLADMAEFCSEAGMVNAVNLDGGGSAQILLNNRRVLKISDRNRENHTEAERPVPLGLVVR